VGGSNRNVQGVVGGLFRNEENGGGGGGEYLTGEEGTGNGDWAEGLGVTDGRGRRAGDEHDSPHLVGEKRSGNLRGRTRSSRSQGTAGSCSGGGFRNSKSTSDPVNSTCHTEGKLSNLS